MISVDVDVFEVRRRAAEIVDSFLAELRAIGELPLSAYGVDMPPRNGATHARITIEGDAAVVRPAREVLYDTLGWAA